MTRITNKNRWLLAAIISTACALTTAGLWAQYTPGSGGMVVPPAPPTPPTPPTPMVPQPMPMQPGDQPGGGDAIRVIQAPPAQVVEQPVAVAQLSDAQMADLTASIALYPDPILAEMFPATTYVEEIAYADKWLDQHPGADEASIALLPVEPSIKSMMHFPGVLSMMADHLDWTQAVGVAFVYQRPDLMGMVQRWRMQAVMAGTLASSREQQVLQQGNTIMIIPAPQAQVIYVPTYDPAVVYVRPVRPGRAVISFAVGGVAVRFADYDLDWRAHEVRIPVVRAPDRDRGPGGDRIGITIGGGGGGGIGFSVTDRPGDRPPERAVFVRDNFKPDMVYPHQVITPQPDHKMVTIPSPPPGRGMGRGRDNGPGGPGGPGNDQGRGNDRGR